MTDELPAGAMSLATIADGSAAELFDVAVRNVLENLKDLNTDAKAKRRVTLTFDFATDEDRVSLQVKLACAMKLAGIRPVTTFARVGMHHGQLVAVEALPQERMFPEPAGKPAAVHGGA